MVCWVIFCLLIFGASSLEIFTINDAKHEILLTIYIDDVNDTITLMSAIDFPPTKDSCCSIRHVMPYHSHYGLCSVGVRANYIGIGKPIETKIIPFVPIFEQEIATTPVVVWTLINGYNVFVAYNKITQELCSFMHRDDDKWGTCLQHASIIPAWLDIQTRSSLIYMKCGYAPIDQNNSVGNYYNVRHLDIQNKCIF